MCAKFSDGQWYRAKVRKSVGAKAEAQVTFIDYGNQDTVRFRDIRPLEARFKSLPGQAHDARLRLAVHFSWKWFSNDASPVVLVSSSWLHRRANTSQTP